MIYLITFSADKEGYMRARTHDEDAAEMVANVFSACASSVYRVGLLAYLFHKIKFYSTSYFLAEKFGKEWFDEEDL